MMSAAGNNGRIKNTRGEDTSMNFRRISELTKRDIVHGVHMGEVHLENLMITFVNLDEGAVVPEHSHPHEQITVVISGSLRFSLADEERIIDAGCAVTIPSNVRHSAVAVGGPCIAYDSWSPVREDYIIK
jgi:quercetin dioxygenase-like cupin family protein